MEKYYLSKKFKSRSSLPLSWEDQVRIVGWMHELVGKQNGETVLECLEEIALYVTNKEMKKYSVDELQVIYKLTTKGKLRSEVRFAQKFSYEWIQKQCEKIRKSNEFSRGFHYDDAQAPLTESEKDGFYELEKRLRMRI